MTVSVRDFVTHRFKKRSQSHNTKNIKNVKKSQKEQT